MSANAYGMDVGDSEFSRFEFEFEFPIHFKLTKRDKRTAQPPPFRSTEVNTVSDIV